MAGVFGILNVAKNSPADIQDHRPMPLHQRREGAPVAARDVPPPQLPVGGGVRITSENTVEVEGASRPALVAETISLQFD